MKEYGGNYYFVFTPTTSGEFTIFSTDEQETEVQLYTENGELLISDGQDRNGFSITKRLQANETYYICVGYVESYHHGHFQVNIIYE